MLAPIIILAAMPTYPQPGVIPTRPATKPLKEPNILGFCLFRISIHIQAIYPLEAEIIVTIKAFTAISSTFPALPELNPNQPINNKIPPKKA